MMKKFVLTLMFVLGMAQVAGAVLSVNNSPTEPKVTIDGLIEFDHTIYLFIASTSPITISEGAAAPSMSAFSLTVPEAIGYGVPIPVRFTTGEAWTMAAAPEEPYQTGTYLIGNGTPGNEFLCGWFDEAQGYGELGGGYFVPEPSTIALLGLGGLLLRRRKK
jgi:hypothetical protein